MKMRANVDLKMLPYSGLITAAILLTALAGVLHFVVAPIHWAHAPAHGLFFMLAGSVQLIWALAVWCRSSSWLYGAGIILAGGLLLLWAITRLAPAPFGQGLEEVEHLGVVCKFAEALALTALTIFVFHVTATQAGHAAAWRTLGRLLFAAVVAGLLAYGVARAAEPLLPWLHAGDEHQHEHEGEPTDSYQASLEIARLRCSIASSVDRLAV